MDKFSHVNRAFAEEADRVLDGAVEANSLWEEHGPKEEQQGSNAVTRRVSYETRN